MDYMDAFRQRIANLEPHQELPAEVWFADIGDRIDFVKSKGFQHVLGGDGEPASKTFDGVVHFRMQTPDRSFVYEQATNGKEMSNKMTRRPNNS